MNWISNWIQGIIIAVIIGTIIEMLLPEGNCKKYVKVVIGVYILFSIVSPVITKVTGNEFRVSSIYNINTYIDVTSKSNQENIEIKQQNQIKQVYTTNLKKDMEQKIEEKGYTVKSISLEIEDDAQCTLKKITLQIKKMEEQPSNTVNEVQSINEIKIEIGNNSKEAENKVKSTTITDKEKSNLKKYLIEVYNVEEKNININ